MELEPKSIDTNLPPPHQATFEQEAEESAQVILAGLKESLNRRDWKAFAFYARGVHKHLRLKYPLKDAYAVSVFNYLFPILSLRELDINLQTKIANSLTLLLK